MLEELLKRNTTKTIEMLIAAAPELLAEEITAFNAKHLKDGKSFEWLMIKKKVDEALLDQLFELEDEWKYYQEASGYFDVPYAFLQKEHLLSFYRKLMADLRDKKTTLQDIESRYPVFAKAIRVLNSSSRSE